MGMSIDEVIKKYKNQAEWEHSHNNTDYYEEYEQIAKWLEQLQKIKEILNDDSYYIAYGSKAETFEVSAICEVLKDE